MKKTKIVRKKIPKRKSNLKHMWVATRMRAHPARKRLKNRLELLVLRRRPNLREI